MGLFDAFKGMQNHEAAPKKAGGHGSHWGAITGAESIVRSIILDAIRNPGESGAIKSGSKTVDAFLSKDEHVKACALTVSNRLLTAYPSIVDGIVHEVIIDGIDEWRNGLEAQIRCRLGPACLAFFDTLYFKNKRLYRKGKRYNFSLSAIAYRISKAEPRTMIDRDGRVLSTRGMAGFMPLQQGDIDDMAYTGPIKDFTVFRLWHSNCYRIRSPILRLDDGSDVDIYTYAPSRALSEYTPKIGDDMSGIVWLQGYLA